MLQSWHALKLQVGQKQPSQGARHTGRSAQHSIPGLLKVAKAQAFNKISVLDPDTGHSCHRKTHFSLLAHFAVIADLGNASMVEASFGSPRSSCQWES